MDRFDAIPFGDISPESSWTRLGKGSFGCVYKGEYLGLEVAIKEVLTSNEYDVDKYFERECKILQESRHPNIVQYLGLCLAPPTNSASNTHSTKVKNVSRPRILIISEYLPRGNLRAYIYNRSLPLPWRLRLSFAIDTTRAVAYLHARQCLHRDLKGENLLVTENERIKVCDFGFARIAAQNEEEMRRMSYCGTDGYMSPEILKGDDFGLSTDIFSLGMILIEIISRQIVDQYNFVRGPPEYLISAEEVRSTASSHCPPALIQLALDCVQAIPSNRPSVLEILKTLREIEAEVLERESRGVGIPKGYGQMGPGKSNSWNVGSSSFAGSSGHRIETEDPIYRLGRREADTSEDESSDESGSEENDVAILARATVSVEGSSSENRKVVIDEKSTSHITKVSMEDSPEPVEGSTSCKSTSASTSSSIQGSNFTLRAFPMPDPHSACDYEFDGFQRLSSDFEQLPALPQSWLRDVDQVQTLSSKIKPNVAQLDPATVVTKAEIFHSTILANSKMLSQVVVSPTFDLTKDQPHRFSLIKPSFQRFFTALGGTPSTPGSPAGKNNTRLQSLHLVNGDPTTDLLLNKKGLLQGGGAGGTTTPASAGETNVISKPTVTPSLKRGSTEEYTNRMLGAVTGGRCNICEKRLGFMTAYLNCDDCGFHCHIKCSDDCPPDCGSNVDAELVVGGTTSEGGAAAGASNNIFTDTQ